MERPSLRVSAKARGTPQQSCPRNGNGSARIQGGHGVRRPARARCLDVPGRYRGVLGYAADQARHPGSRSPDRRDGSDLVLPGYPWRESRAAKLDQFARTLTPPPAEVQVALTIRLHRPQAVHVAADCQGSAIRSHPQFGQTEPPLGSRKTAGMPLARRPGGAWKNRGLVRPNGATLALQRRGLAERNRASRRISIPVAGPLRRPSVLRAGCGRSAPR